MLISMKSFPLAQKQPAIVKLEETRKQTVEEASRNCVKNAGVGTTGPASYQWSNTKHPVSNFYLE